MTLPASDIDLVRLVARNEQTANDYGAPASGKAHERSLAAYMAHTKPSAGQARAVAEDYVHRVLQERLRDGAATHVEAAQLYGKQGELHTAENVGEERLFSLGALELQEAVESLD